jgi:hypothetical protein
MMKSLKRQSGQAVLEYLFIVVFVVLVFSTIINNLRTQNPPLGTGVCPLWGVMVRQVAAGCAGCSESVDANGRRAVCLFR